MYVTSLHLILAALREKFDVPVGRAFPRAEPDLFIRVDGAAPKSQSPVSETTLFTIQVYGSDLQEVLDLIGDIRHFLMHEVYVGSDLILGWDEQAGPHDFPDPDTNAFHRWQITGIATTTIP